MTSIESPRDLPKVDELLRDCQLNKSIETLGYLPVRDAVRAILDAARETLLGKAKDDDNILPDAIYLDDALAASKKHDPKASLSPSILTLAVLQKLDHEAKPGIRKVINATGAILHTNLGRAPLSKQALDAIKGSVEGYCSLEFDLAHNRRGQRTTSIEALLCRMFHVEAALVVNNNAAAVMLALSALCRGREVIVSRGELVEIGGLFRIPDIMEESQAILREVGTTNKTHLFDYERAIGDSTAALLKVHTSNFRLIGFTEEVADKDLASLAHERGLPLIYDLGSGCISTELASLMPDEPTVATAIASGADVICFSGDKLLGGPQAGIIIGKSKQLDAMRSHPLTRAFRCDKMTLIALEATLALYLDPDLAKQHIPLLGMVLYDLDTLHERTRKLAEELSNFGIFASPEPSEMIFGGGSAPELRMPSWALAIRPENTTGQGSVTDLESSLRCFDPPILCRTAHDLVLLDLRTVSEREERMIASALIQAFGKGADIP
ncbi:MAG TPA: L-seryl-tRNA(Sec) selenium transferase [Clostridia bacterium]|nr:L-seryl-tRNA(Sec) selenium transferase [Clostridia bacterium]